MKKVFWIILSALLLVGCAMPTDGDAGYRSIPMEEATALLQQEQDYILLDVRTWEEFASGHIPGAICIPNETISDQPLPELPRKDQRIYVYCRSGNRSKQAAGKLVKLGYTNVVEIGGIRQWPGETVPGK